MRILLDAVICRQTVDIGQCALCASYIHKPVLDTQMNGCRLLWTFSFRYGGLEAGGRTSRTKDGAVDLFDGAMTIITASSTRSTFYRQLYSAGEPPRESTRHIDIDRCESSKRFGESGLFYAIFHTIVRLRHILSDNSVWYQSYCLPRHSLHIRHRRIYYLTKSTIIFIAPAFPVSVHWSLSFLARNEAVNKMVRVCVCFW